MAYTRTPNLQLFSFTALTGGALAAPLLVAGLLAQRAVFRTVRAACTMLRRATMSADHGRGRPNGEKRRWRCRRSNSRPSGPAVFAADSDCDLPAACLRCIGNRAAYNTSCQTSCSCGSLDELHRKGSRCYPYLGKPLCPALPFRGLPRKTPCRTSGDVLLRE